MSDAEENPLEAEEDGETEMEEEGEDNTNYYKEVENMQQASQDDTAVWGASREEEEGEEEGEEQEEEEEKPEEGEEEEEEEEAAVRASDLEEDAQTVQEAADAGIQGDTTAELQELTTSTISLERLTATDHQSALSETFSQTYSTSESKHSLQSEHPRSLGAQLEFLGVDLTSSEEQETDSAERWLSDEPGEKTSQTAQDKPEPERGGLEPEGEKKKEKTVSYFIEETEFQPKDVVSKDSLVSTTTEDMLFQKKDGDSVYPLTLSWSFGWNSSLPVYYIRDKSQRVLLYASAHTAVIYDVHRNSQHHLQGHPNVISCFCISEDRRWIATADKGPSCLIIIWDSFTGIPVHTIFDSCPDGSGIRAIAMTVDAKYLATISDAEVQKVCIWRWTLAVETPACTLDLPKEYGLQSYLTFNPTNNKELVSNSKTQAIYYSWNEEGHGLTHSAPVLTEKTFNKLVGKFSQSIFHPNSTHMLSATLEGKLVVWAVHRPPLAASAPLGRPYVEPCKLVRLQKESITVLTAVDRYIVTGDVEGHIKFYDHSLALVNWYGHFDLGPIRALSFARTPASPPTENSSYPPDCTLKGGPFVVRNFIIGTADAAVYHLTADGTRLDKLLVEPRDAVCAIACHPYRPLIAIGSLCGTIRVWDYEKKTHLFSRVFGTGLGVQSLTYNPEGALLGAGFAEGTVYVLDAMSLANEVAEPFKYSGTSVTHISFSHDSRCMATADTSFTVAVYRIRVRNGRRVWEYLARLRSHRQSVQSLLFGVHLDSNAPRLLSLGRDRLLIEYNLLKSRRDHLEVLDVHQTDQGDHPTCMIWYPPLTKEQFLLICNSGYKVKLFNSTTKMCRKTLLGPVYGSPIEQVQLLPVKTATELRKRYLVFVNRDKVGLQILPIDGNPHKTSAVTCHPDGVAGIALSYDGRYAFTAGGRDRSVIQWEVHLRALEAAVSLGGEGLTPLYSLVPGGREGRFYRELEDYFYYSQLRGQGIDTMETRRVSEHIGLPEVPFVMRAIGFYPSEEEIEDMFNEIRFSEYVDSGQIVDKINLPDFLKVYLNHRPPFGNTMHAIQKSFDVLGHTNSEGKRVIRREDFLKLLLTKGEHMTEEELSGCLATLLGLNPEGWKSEPAATATKGSQLCLEDELPAEITAEIFATEILDLALSSGARREPTASPSAK